MATTMSSHAPEARPVLVGVDDSPSGRAALDAAIRLARSEHAPLRLVRVWRDVDWFLSGTSRPVAGLVEDRHAEQTLFAGVCAYARTAAPEIVVTGDFAPGSLHTALLERSESARMIVLGTSTTEAGPGAIGSWYLDHAPCPVTVIAPDGTTVARSDGCTEPRLAALG